MNRYGFIQTLKYKYYAYSIKPNILEHIYIAQGTILLVNSLTLVLLYTDEYWNVINKIPHLDCI